MTKSRFAVMITGLKGFAVMITGLFGAPGISREDW